MRFLLLSALMLCCNISAAQAAAKTELTERVTAIKPDGSITLSSSGNAVLTNVLLPDAKRAESWLAANLLQQNITFTTEEEDRYGRTAITSDAQEKMLRDGAAIIYASDGKIPKVWYTAETAARTAKTGIWGEKDFTLTPQNAAQHMGEFHVVEGPLTRMYEAKSATYLNFGEDWHTDFSITIPAKFRRGLKDELAALKPGSVIRIRGAIYEENGPMIKLNRPANLELR